MSWIKVSEKLPPENEWILFKVKSCMPPSKISPTLGYYRDSDTKFLMKDCRHGIACPTWDIKYISLWMPIPNSENSREDLEE